MGNNHKTKYNPLVYTFGLSGDLCQFYEPYRCQYKVPYLARTLKSQVSYDSKNTLNQQKYLATTLFCWVSLEIIQHFFPDLQFISCF